MVPLYVDAREDASHHFSTSLRRLGVDARVGKNLPTDFLWQSPAGLVFLERKTWEDFVASVVGKGGGADASQRLRRQLVDTPRSSVRVLLLEGPMPPFYQGGQVIPAETMDNMLASLQWQFGALVVHSLGLTHTPLRVASFYRYTQEEEHKALIRPIPPVPEEKIYMDPTARLKVAALMTTPGLGEKGALELLEHVKWDLGEATALTYEELLQVPNFGRVRARQFVEFWRNGQEEKERHEGQRRRR